MIAPIIIRHPFRMFRLQLLTWQHPSWWMQSVRRWWWWSEWMVGMGQCGTIFRWSDPTECRCPDLLLLYALLQWLLLLPDIPQWQDQYWWSCGRKSARRSQRSRSWPRHTWWPGARAFIFYLLLSQSSSQGAAALSLKNNELGQLATQILDDPQAIRPIAEMIYDLVNQKKHLDIEEISGYANNKE